MFLVGIFIFVQNVTHVLVVVPDGSVGARLHQFWEKWDTLGSSPKAKRILRQSYIVPFQIQGHRPPQAAM